jgi:hypothetical protein
MVITTHIDKWNVMRVLVDNGSQVEILFLSTIEQMGFSSKQLKERSKLLYGFGGKKIEPVGSISLSLSFGTLSNAHTKYITFDVVDMSYPYNAIFGKGHLNTFDVALLGMQVEGPTEIPTSRLTLAYRILMNLRSTIRITTHLHLFCRIEPSTRRSPGTKSFTQWSLGISKRLPRRPQGGHGLHRRSSAC